MSNHVQPWSHISQDDPVTVDHVNWAPILMLCTKQKCWNASNLREMEGLKSDEFNTIFI